MSLKCTHFFYQLRLMPIQAVIFSKSEWTANNAMKWLKLHGLKPIKRVHKTKNYLRYRIGA